jgi:cell division protein FtsL
VTRLSLVLLLALLGSGMYLVRTSYEARRLFVELERAKAEETQLLADVRRLDAERRSEGTLLKVERDARQKLGMRMSGADVTVYVSDLAASGVPR